MFSFNRMVSRLVSEDLYGWLRSWNKIDTSIIHYYLPAEWFLLALRN
jgi:hypothetical protein